MVIFFLTHWQLIFSPSFQLWWRNRQLALCDSQKAPLQLNTMCVCVCSCRAGTAGDFSGEIKMMLSRAWCESSDLHTHAHTCAQMHACTHTLSNTCLIVIAFQDTLDSYQLGYTATPFDDSVTVVPDGKNGTWQRVCICVCGWNELFNIRPCKCMEMNNFLISWCYLKVFLFFIFAVSVSLHFSIGVINFKLLCVCM